MPSRGTKHRPIRVDDDMWDAFAASVADAGLPDRSAAIRQFIAWYTRQPGVKLPARPPARKAPDHGDR